MYDVVIIGAGVVGAMVARELSKYKLNICVLEKENDVACGATKANSAIVHAGYDAKEGTLKAKLNVLGSKMMKQVCHDLGVKYINNGSLVIGFNDEDKATIESLYQRGIRNGVERLEVLDYEALHKLEPNVSKNATCALYAPTGAITCPYELTVAAIGNAMDNGVELKCNFEVTSIEKIDSRYIIKSQNETIESKVVINAAGIYSDLIARMIGDDSFNVHARRGEYILLDKECGKTVSHTIFKTPSKMGKGILVTPTVDGNLLLGPTSVDIEDKDNKNTTDEGFAKIISLANENVDNINLRQAITSFCGLRSVGSTGDFIINSPIDGFINVAGIESPGLSAAPAIGVYVKDLLAEQMTLVEKENYIKTRKSMTHFADASVEEKNEIIKKDSTYGRIICRCETVTEGEILEALRTNPKPTDLDGIKRRTRAQMGRCQGGFCMPYIVKLIAQETGMSIEKVTKNGNGSNLIFSKTKEGC
jgi:glycerol-3-phosphate dehydrogenase